MKTMLLAIVLLASGCGLFSMPKQSAQPPAKPVATPAQKELQRQNADFAGKVLDRVAEQGAPAAAPLIRQAARAAEAVSGDLGKPAKPVALPPVGVDTPMAEADKALAAYEAGVAAERAKAEKAAASPPPSSGSSSVWWLFLLGGAAVLGGAVIVGLSTFGLLKMVPLGGALALGGAACVGLGVVIERYPQVFLWVFIAFAAMVLAGVGWFFWHLIGTAKVAADAKAKTQALGAVVAAVAAAPADAAEAVKDKIKPLVTASVGAKDDTDPAAVEAYAQVKSTISGMKQDLGIPQG